MTSTFVCGTTRRSLEYVSNPATPDLSSRRGRRAHGDGSASFSLRASAGADRVLGLHQLDRLYREYELAGLPAHRFAARALDGMGVRIDGGESFIRQVPASGPLIVVANHPHGGIEGLVLLKLLAQSRPDTKILANAALRVFDELTSHFLFVNPLNSKDPANRSGFRESLRHLEQGGVLVVFPAGRTSFYQPDLKTIADSAWSRSVARLARRSQAPVLPVRFTGTNSKLFYRLGEVWYRFRLMMLARELVKMQGQRVQIAVGVPAPPERLQRYDDETLTEMLRVLCASLRVDEAQDATSATHAPLAPPGDRTAIADEIAALPEAQRSVTAHGMVVGFAARADIPELVQQIARDRERTFRLLDEGSGAPL
ncbi:MAG: lysophospholipid acyltransferase family protein, partial [Pseudomonadota bacterium]